MDTDPQFAVLNSAVAELKTLNDAFLVALVENVNGGRIATIQKNDCKSALLRQLHCLALMVDLKAEGDESIVLAAGFNLKKQPTSRTTLAEPDVAKVTNESTPGLVKIQLTKVKGANNYSVEKRVVTIENPEGVWVTGTYSSSLKIKLTDLESGKLYQLRFRAIGRRGLVSAWSAVREVFVS